MDGGKDGAHRRACDSDLGELEGYGPGVADKASADLDQFHLDAGK